MNKCKCGKGAITVWYGEPVCRDCYDAKKEKDGTPIIVGTTRDFGNIMSVVRHEKKKDNAEKNSIQTD